MPMLNLFHYGIGKLKRTNNMVKLKRDLDKVHSKAIYAWSYHNIYTYRFCKSITEKSFYKKKYCQIPFYSRVHAKHVLVTLYGVDALKYVHFTSGKKLRANGMKIFKHQRYPYTLYFGEGGIQSEVYIKAIKDYKIRRIYFGSLKKYIYPPEFMYDKHRRRYFAVLLQRKRRQGITKFNKWYKEQFYGSRQGVSRIHLRCKRKEVNDALLQEIPSLKPTSRKYRTGDI